MRGLNTPKKIRQVLADLDRHNISVALIQETHLTPRTAGSIGARWAGYWLASAYSSYSRGVLTLIKRGLPFAEISKFADANGRYCIVHGRLMYALVNIVNTYGPNIDDPAFYETVLNILHTLPPAVIIWGGTLTCIWTQQKTNLA